MVQPPDQPFAVARVTQMASDLSRALDGFEGGPVTPDAVDDRFPQAVTVRECLMALRAKIEAFLGDV